VAVMILDLGFKESLAKILAHSRLVTGPHGASQAPLVLNLASNLN